MDFKFSENFSPNSKVWIYQSDRRFRAEEVAAIENELNSFSNKWTAHKMDLKATGTLLMSQFIILLVDESEHSASGCSIDTSVHFIRKLENQYGVKLLERSVLLFELGGDLIGIPLAELSNKISDGTILPETIYYNNSVSNLNELKLNWRIAAKKSWLAAKFSSVPDWL